MSAGDFFQELGPAEEDFGEDVAGIEEADEEFENARVAEEGFEEESAQAVTLDEADEAGEGDVGVGDALELGEELRLETDVELAGARGNEDRIGGPDNPISSP